jgi:hypothetical protein
MSNRSAAAIVAAMLAGTPTFAGAQAIPRTTDGKPDLSGVWQVLNTASWNIEPHGASKDIPAGQGVVEGGEIPYQPWALRKREENFQNRATADPESNCYLPGIPRITYMPYPFRIVQAPKQISILYEYVHAVRNIYMDSKHPEGPIEWWMGDSRGRWDGDTLVVDVVHFNDQTWFDRAGNFHSEALHLVERYTPIDATHVNYEVMVEDPKVFTRPWKMSMPLYKRLERDVQVLEYECHVYEVEERARSSSK